MTNRTDRLRREVEDDLKALKKRVNKTDEDTSHMFQGARDLGHEFIPPKNPKTLWERNLVFEAQLAQANAMRDGETDSNESPWHWRTQKAEGVHALIASFFAYPRSWREETQEDKQIRQDVLALHRQGRFNLIKEIKHPWRGSLQGMEDRATALGLRAKDIQRLKKLEEEDDGRPTTYPKSIYELETRYELLYHDLLAVVSDVGDTMAQKNLMLRDCMGVLMNKRRMDKRKLLRKAVRPRDKEASTATPGARVATGFDW